ncbi:MAG: B12-binding domain-containing radical SAM protein [Nitrospirota bacterium]|nr:B12-binding domain-containing radical SAM protein [Nitrospirota bacterium]MDH4359216.1 B12-binding domain-containing radical SAM protein [Nitrospirota bacterium]MDH5295669.1 B12-binding domain-containing radical SAM protein [Nitrospirota bacterium]MDH5574216.1 B12-binding domain-containing radical SAM protein [Nitrospirota bacterium]
MDTTTIPVGIRPKLLLLDPYPRNNPYRMTASERRSIWFPKLSLPVIAAYTPPTWDIELVDEAVADINFDTPCDLVGLSIMTCYAPRAYEIADEFRRRGKKVVLGGVHPTYCPDEALRHCDAIVCGEAEDLWPQVVADVEAGTLKRIYRMDQFPALSDYKPPRIELLSPDSYMTRLCSFTTRGCHFDCEFCSVSPFNGKTTRRRPVPEVIEELKRAKEWLRSDIIERMTRGSLLNALTTSLKIWVGLEEGSIVAFVDDLHNSHRAYCRELWQALKSLNIKWGCQSTLFLGDDPEMVKLAADSGCVSVFVGMESLSDDSLDETNKGFNQVRKFENQIKMFHDHGIMVNPGLVFGFDNDDESVFETAVEFLTRNKVELAYFNVLTPLPGTALFERYKREGRIFDQDWSKYDGKHVVYKPKRMTPEQLQEGFFWANHQFYSWPCILNRVGHTSQRLIPRLEMNWEFRKLICRTTPKGTLSPLAKVLKNLQAKLPTFETQQLIPNALLPQTSPGSKPQELCLKVKARRHDAFAALFIELEGTLDHLNAKELLDRIKQAARDAKMDIVVNFENLKQATPKAIHTLLDGEILKAITPHTKLRYRKLKEAFQTAVSEVSPGDLDLFDEGAQHA